MTVLTDLAAMLRADHASAPTGKKVASIHLFGIKHHAVLQGLNKKTLAEAAGLPVSYGAELQKAMVLGEYVTIIKPLA